jgi:hypothetical protein
MVTRTRKGSNTMEPRTITADTRVVVTMKGEQGSYGLAGSGGAALSSWANTLSDLTGYTTEALILEITDGLGTAYGVTLSTSAGDLCPIKFLITVEAVAQPARTTA